MEKPIMPQDTMNMKQGSSVVDNAVKGTAIAQKRQEDKNAKDKYPTFSEIHTLVSDAEKLYTTGKLSFDEALGELIQTLGKLKGKESALKTVGKDKFGNVPVAG